MEYYLVHISGRMGFELAHDADQAMYRAARDFGYDSTDDVWDELEAQSLDSVNLEDVQYILAMGGYVPDEVRKHFGIAPQD